MVTEHSVNYETENKNIVTEKNNVIEKGNTEK